MERRELTACGAFLAKADEARPLERTYACQTHFIRSDRLVERRLTQKRHRRIVANRLEKHFSRGSRPVREEAHLTWERGVRS